MPCLTRYRGYAEAALHLSAVKAKKGKAIASVSAYLGFTLSFRCAPSPTAQAPYAGCLSTSQQHQAEEKAAAAAAARAQGVGG